MKLVLFCIKDDWGTAYIISSFSALHDIVVDKTL